MTRPYTLRKRAEQQAETRARIVEAAIELHSTVGPAQTTFSMIAERAGVQRHTLYAHFPDEWSIALACSGAHLERAPLPDAAAWRAIAAPIERLRAGLAGLYDYFARNASLMTCVLRDAEHHALTRDIMAMRFGPQLGAMQGALCESLGDAGRALVPLAMSFHTWRTLTRDSGLDQAAAVEAMVQAIACAERRAG
ncbi:MAG: TetR/AcrR family transcriptional regulator [Hyphomonadaceae bacterium]|nr:TetR/AcrR family transcriptional regulator [Hyphomonadaceae bacterium]